MNTYNIFKKLLLEAKPSEDQAIKRICSLNNVTVILRQDETNYKIIKYDFKTDDNLTYEILHKRIKLLKDTVKYSTLNECKNQIVMLQQLLVDNNINVK